MPHTAFWAHLIITTDHETMLLSSHCTDKGMESQEKKCWLTCPRSHFWHVVNWDLNLVSLIPDFMSLTIKLTHLSWVYDYEFMDTDLCNYVNFLLQNSSVQVWALIIWNSRFRFSTGRCIRKLSLGLTRAHCYI